eukprot:SAG11_NODE_7388_length_1151_cov_1.256654_1_plen_102_part_00
MILVVAPCMCLSMWCMHNDSNGDRSVGMQVAHGLWSSRAKLRNLSSIGEATSPKSRLQMVKDAVGEVEGTPRANDRAGRGESEGGDEAASHAGEAPERGSI